jgi:hypothetical protein
MTDLGTLGGTENLNHGDQLGAHLKGPGRPPAMQ